MSPIWAAFSAQLAGPFVALNFSILLEFTHTFNQSVVAHFIVSEALVTGNLRLAYQTSYLIENRNHGEITANPVQLQGSLHDCFRIIVFGASLNFSGCVISYLCSR
jgi:hypothetical protein